MKTLEERFWAKVDKSGDCWIWKAAISDGYGKFGWGSTSRRAHRVSFEFTFGPIPDGLDIDHRCHSRACVNPEHLRAVTRKQNSEHLLGAHRDSMSGVRGVYWNASRKKWAAQVGHKGRTMYIGLYLTIEEAEAAVIAKRLELFTHNEIDKRRAA